MKLPTELEGRAYLLMCCAGALLCLLASGCLS